MFYENQSRTPLSRNARIEQIIEQRNANPASSYQVTPTTQAMVEEFQEIRKHIRDDLHRLHQNIGIMKDIALEKGPKDLLSGTVDKEFAEGLYDYIAIALSGLE